MHNHNSVKDTSQSNSVAGIVPFLDHNSKTEPYSWEILGFAELHTHKRQHRFKRGPLINAQIHGICAMLHCDLQQLEC